jgi:large subunit ribosomal protein L28
VYKQSNAALYGSARIRFGNNVSEEHQIKTRRKWRPNIHQKRLWSDALGVFVRTKLTTRVLRTIDKVGGLDEYLLGEKPGRVKELGPWGWKLRWRVMQTPAVKARFAAQRQALGLPPAAETTTTGDSVSEGDVPAEVAMEHLTPGRLMEETTKMLDAEEEFAIGELSGDEGFMREEQNPR